MSLPSNHLPGSTEDFPAAGEVGSNPLSAFSEVDLVFVAGGTFSMGCTKEQQHCYDDEIPVHTVTVSDFNLSKYQVTQKQWQAVMGTNPSIFLGCENCPVENVSWDEVQDFLAKLNVLKGISYRLPTESE